MSPTHTDIGVGHGRCGFSGSKQEWTRGLAVLAYGRQKWRCFMMDADERDIYFYLKALQALEFAPTHAICRHAGGKHKQRESPNWAKPALQRMLERGIVEVNSEGAYRLKPFAQGKAGPKRWVSPQIAAILKKSGRNFNAAAKDDGDTDTYYNSL